MCYTTEQGLKIAIRENNDVLTKKEIRHIIRFTGNFLLGKRMCGNITVVLRNKVFKKYEWGYCGPTNYDNYRHREFEILLNSSTTRKNQIVTILHEMIHLKQYARGELVCYSGMNLKWLGQKIDVTEMEYVNYPWEIEANLSEKVLYELYMEHVRHEKNFDRLSETATSK